ncbi:hypothetical protein BEQ56_00780 [Anaerolineaceae bacterium oral taxon 439]|nr:hypothetical protein BEQ56_00780 [Anaerolineaceae bacterium oral taxon 439]
MNETDEKLERLAIRYWTMASIPAGARKGYVKGYLDGVLDALNAAGRTDVLLTAKHEKGEG